jgi:hypothetical protein
MNKLARLDKSEYLRDINVYFNESDNTKISIDPKIGSHFTAHSVSHGIIKGIAHLGQNAMMSHSTVLSCCFTYRAFPSNKARECLYTYLKNNAEESDHHFIRFWKRKTKETRGNISMNIQCCGQWKFYTLPYWACEQSILLMSQSNCQSCSS